MKLGGVEDITADIGPEGRTRIDAIKRNMINTERGHELASLRKAQGMTQAHIVATLGNVSVRL